MHNAPRNDLRGAIGAAAAVALVTGLYTWAHVANPTTIALTYLLVVLIIAAISSLGVAIATSAVSVILLNFFFMPPVGRFTIADPENWIALLVFLTVSLVASNLSSVAGARAGEAVQRRDEMSRLFDLSRDVLLTTDSREAIQQLARFVARRFDLDYVAIAFPRGGEWQIVESGSPPIALDADQLTLAAGVAERTLEFDARERTYAGHRTIETGDGAIRIVPLRLGVKPIGALAAAGRPIEPGSLDALGGVVASAIERVQLLEERKAAELARQSEELKSALLASLGHDLRTPLTAIRVAATNLQASWLGESERREQSQVVLAEVERLTRLFEDILDMARIDAGAVATEVRWVHPAEIIESARERVAPAVDGHPVRVDIRAETLVRLDPRLTAAALAHLLDNAAKYSPAGAAIEVDASIAGRDLLIAVRDHGCGMSPADLPRVFDRFYRGAQSGRVSGTGMGLSIVRGLLAVEQGRVRAENCADGGARFTIAVPVEQKPLEATA
ncbi:MAG TPA: ATP-binding protein [Vicinamibacterales bacterium]|nr:ATP-binding protein [Vicinamibacterales bacterium]